MDAFSLYPYSEVLLSPLSPLSKAQGYHNFHAIGLDTIAPKHIYGDGDLYKLPAMGSSEGGLMVSPMLGAQNHTRSHFCEAMSVVAEVPAITSKRYEENHNNDQMKKDHVKGPWSDKEDSFYSLLIDLVHQFGDNEWSQVAESMGGRIRKQCRERWHNHLRPDIKKGAWTEEEDTALIELHKKWGNKWTRIAKELKGRSGNCIKNHWNATKRRKLPSCLQKYINDVENSTMHQVGPEVVPTTNMPSFISNCSSDQLAPSEGCTLDSQFDHDMLSNICFLDDSNFDLEMPFGIETSMWTEEEKDPYLFETI